MTSQCPHCRKSYKAPSSLQRHIITTHREQPDLVTEPNAQRYSCIWCPKTFTRSDARVRHIRQTHSSTNNSDNITCKICTAPICRRDYAKKHRRICLGKLFADPSRMAFISSSTGQPDNIFSVSRQPPTNDYPDSTPPESGTLTSKTEVSNIRFKSHSPPELSSVEYEIRRGLVEAIHDDDPAYLDILVSQTRLSDTSVDDFDCSEQFQYVSTSTRTLLHKACENGAVRVIRYLLERGANMERPTSDGETCLFLACMASHTASVKALLHAGANTNHIYDDLSSRTHCFTRSTFAAAFDRGCIDIAKLLIQHDTTNGAALPEYFLVANRTSSTRHTRHTKDQYRIIEYFLTHITSKGLEYHFRGILMSAIKMNERTIVQICLKQKVSLDFQHQNNTPLSLAFSKHRNQIFRLLLEAGASPDGDGRSKRSLLYQALSQHRADIFQMLVDAGVNVNLKPEEIYSVPWDHQRLRILIDAGFDTSAHQEFFLNYAIRKYNINLLKLLIEQKMPLELISTDLIHELRRDCSAPRYTAKYGRPLEILQLLRQHGLDINRPS